MRLFCFPYSGANAWIYQRWDDGLPEAIAVYPVELPGHGTLRAMPPLTRMEAMVKQVARAVIPYLDQPFALFGHSMGALLAFELARYLLEGAQADASLPFRVGSWGSPSP